MTIGDLLDPIYITGAPKTFFLKLMIGVITGLVAHKLGKITYSTDKKHVFKWTVLAACAGMLFNFIFDPIISYFYDMLILGKPMAQLKIAWSVTTTGVNAVISVIAVGAVPRHPAGRQMFAKNCRAASPLAAAEGSRPLPTMRTVKGMQSAG